MGEPFDSTEKSPFIGFEICSEILLGTKTVPNYETLCRHHCGGNHRTDRTDTFPLQSSSFPRKRIYRAKEGKDAAEGVPWAVSNGLAWFGRCLRDEARQHQRASGSSRSGKPSATHPPHRHKKEIFSPTKLCFMGAANLSSKRVMVWNELNFMEVKSHSLIVSKENLYSGSTPFGNVASSGTCMHIHTHTLKTLQWCVMKEYRKSRKLCKKIKSRSTAVIEVLFC